MTMNFLKNRIISQWIQQFFNTSTACLLFVFMDWIFMVTKPSYLSKVTWSQKFLVLLKGFFLFNGFALAIIVVLSAVSLLLNSNTRKLMINISNFLPALILATTFFLMIDNFTYTALHFGIGTSQGIFRIIYAIIFLLLIFLSFRFFSAIISLNIKRVEIKFATVGIFIILFFLTLPRNATVPLAPVNSMRSDLPNIILVGSDGVSADHMSVYGYERKTTPNIEQFAQQSLFVENAFTNSAETSGSLIAILASRYPTQTRVLYPPDMLSGTDAVQHLPGILKNMGYYTAELSFGHYADAFALGMQNSFDEVNQ